MSKFQQNNKRTRRKESDQRRSPKNQVFCNVCYAIKFDEDVCPRCDLGLSTYEKFCRKCLHVHECKEKCLPWKASEV